MIEMEVIINKNRGWRGLASVTVRNDTHEIVGPTHIFSFSQDMWDDLYTRRLLVIDDVNDEGEPIYTVFTFKETDIRKLPTGQRSRVITSTHLEVVATHYYPLDKPEEFLALYPTDTLETMHRKIAIKHYRNNTNAHTMSEFNMVGIRVQPCVIYD